MRRELILAHLMAMRSAIDALVLEFTEGDEAACCSTPKIQTIETYGSGRWQECFNCGTKRNDKVSGAVGQPDEVRGG